MTTTSSPIDQRRTRRICFAWIVVLLVGLVGGAASVDAQPAPERRVALVIGIGAYQSAPKLPNPDNDAKAVGESLRRLNFEVDELYDPDNRALSRGIRAFGIKAQQADVAVVFYAGHGVQVGRENYLLPADARLERERDLLYEAVPLELLLGEVSQAGKLGIVLLDACRNNPFVERMSRSMTLAGRGVASAGLARVDNVPRNTVVAMATKADQVAEDGDGAHSPFTVALQTYLAVPGLELSLFFRSVRDSVLRTTGGRQEPYVFSSLGAEPFYFNPRPPNRPPVLGAMAPLELRDTSGPTPLAIGAPTDPDQDPLTVRITGLPQYGEVQIDGRPVRPGAVVTTDRITAATYKPELNRTGAVGTLDILVEDGRGGAVMGSVGITVLPSNRPPVVEVARRIRMYTGPIGIRRPEDPDGDPLTVLIKTVPRGLVRDGAQQIRAGDRMRPEALAGLVFVPEPGYVGSAGLLAYQVDDGRGGVVESSAEIDVMDAAEAASQMAEASLWERLRGTGKPEDLDLFLRLYPNSRFAPALAQRSAELVRQNQPVRAPAPPSPAPPSPAPPSPVPLSPAPSMPAASVPVTPPPPSPAPERLAMLQPPSTRMVTPPPLAEPGIKDCPDCPTLMNIPGGSFMMGQNIKDPAALPIHRVTVRSFALGQVPVTVADWNACMADKACGPRPRMAVAEDDTPMHNMSWDDAQQYIAWLSHAAGRPYRLPTEAEWEYAARAGTSTRFPWGDQLGVSLANCSDCGGVQDTHAPALVRRFEPNAFGLYGMSGGVAQWVQDCWFPNYAGAPTDGSARETRGCLQRVLRGGSFRSSHDDIVPAARNHYDGPVRYFLNGFRVARDTN